MNLPSLQAETYTSASEIIRGAQSVRARLLRPANAYKTGTKPVEPVTPPAPVYRPLRLVQKDDHVKRWRWHLANQAMRCRSHMERRAAELGFTVAQIRGSSRTKELVAARQLLMWEIKTIVKPDISLPEIGRMFDRDHTTVLHGIRKVAEMKARAAE